MAQAELISGKQHSFSKADWKKFISSGSAEVRCQTWLQLICSTLPEVKEAAILLENPADHSWVPIAVWPQASSEMARMGEVIEVALKEQRGALRSAPAPSTDIMAAWPLKVGGKVAGIVALTMTRPQRNLEDILHQVHWGCAWLTNLLLERDRSNAVKGEARLASVLETMSVVLRHPTLKQALFEAVHVLRQHFDCARVAFGLTNATAVTVSIAALSDAASFERRSPLVRAYEDAMNEAFDAHLAVLSPQPVRETEGGTRASPRHDALRELSGSATALSYPLSVGAKCIGVVTLERKDGTFNADDLLWLDAFAALVAPVIQQRQAAERGFFSRLISDSRKLLSKLFGPRHLTIKVATCLVFTLAIVCVFTPIDYRVSARTVIEGEVQRVVAAPFAGFIGEAWVRAGDTVKEFQPLAQLDDRELRIEEARWSSERDQYANKLQEAMAKSDLVAIQVLSAQLRQAEAQLELVNKKIEHAKLTAPFDGVVVSGDLSQQIGAPVEVGQKLFEIAPLHSYRVILEVDEREIRHVHVGQAGRLVMTGIAGDAMDFTVAKVTSVATAEEGKNFFRVEASLADASPRLRPGMEGIGKIEVGRESLWWVMTHSFTEWLALYFWKWLP